MILVTGGTGLVGSHLLLDLCKSNQTVRAIYRSKQSLSKVKRVFQEYNQLSSFNKIEWQKADLTDYFSLKDQMSGIEYIYHAAAKVSFAAGNADKMMSVNIDGTHHLVNLALEFGVKKFCYVSSVAALGKYTDQRCTDEETIWQKTDQTSNYSISKYYAENEVWRAAEEGLSVVIVNPATIIGYGEWTESSSTIIKRVADGLSFYPPGANGFVGVKDVARAMTLLMNSEIKNQRYVLVSENLSFHKLLSMIASSLERKPPNKSVSKWFAQLLMIVDNIRSKLTGSPPVLTKESIETAFKSRCYSSEKIIREFNFEFEKMGKVVEETCNHYSRLS